MEGETPYKDLLRERKEPNYEFYSTVKFLFVLLSVLACFTIVFTQILIGVKVVGPSMLPTLETGDYLFVSTLAEPNHGDIVVVPNPRPSGGQYLIKRVVGLPGDTIKAENGILYRKGPGESDFSAVVEGYLEGAWTHENKILPVTIKPGHMYVLGDNRNNSTDSRELDQFKIVEMLGVVTDWSIAHKEFLTAVFGFLQ